MSDSEKKQSVMRGQTWCFFFMSLGLLIVGVAAPVCSALLSWRPSGEALAIWFMRSGSITTIFSLLAVTVLELASNKLHKPGTWGDNDALQVLNEFRAKFSIVEWSAFVLTIIGTVIWGYGDLIWNWLAPAAPH